MKAKVPLSSEKHKYQNKTNNKPAFHLIIRRTLGTSRHIKDIVVAWSIRKYETLLIFQRKVLPLNDYFSLCSKSKIHLVKINENCDTKNGPYFSSTRYIVTYSPNDSSIPAQSFYSWDNPPCSNTMKVIQKQNRYKRKKCTQHERQSYSPTQEGP